MKIYGYHQDPWDFGGRATIYCSIYLWTVRNHGQEWNQVTDYPMYGFHIWNHGSKYTVISQVFKTLKCNKFKTNLYNPCVANRLVNGLQQFILFHVDDFKLSQKDPKVNYSFIGVLREEYQSF